MTHHDKIAVHAASGITNLVSLWGLNDTVGITAVLPTISTISLWKLKCFFQLSCHTSCFQMFFLPPPPCHNTLYDCLSIKTHTRVALLFQKSVFHLLLKPKCTKDKIGDHALTFHALKEAGHHLALSVHTTFNIYKSWNKNLTVIS